MTATLCILKISPRRSRPSRTGWAAGAAPLLAATLLSTTLLAACAATPSLDVEAIEPGAYTLDPSHASLVWRVGHANDMSRYTARFDSLDAELDFDPARPELARLSVTVDAASVSTGLPDFDDKIATHARLFDAANHPQIRFESRSIRPTGARTGEVTGDLTLRGQTRPVTLDVTFNGGAFDPLRRADAIGFSATGVLVRSEFGADAFINFGVGDEVELMIEAEFLKR